MSDDHDIRTPLEMLKAILAFGELACVSADHGYGYAGGKKPASKDVFQFPRHMLEDIHETVTEAEKSAWDEDLEARAKIIYDAMPFDEPHGHKTKPEWVPHGNSLKQQEARSQARSA